MKFKLLLIICMSVLFSAVTYSSGNCDGGSSWVDTSYMRIKVYQVAVSATTDCSNPIVILSNPRGREMDFLKKPTIGSGNIPNGTYPCLMLTISDQIKINPTANDGASCVAGTQYIKDTCRSDDGIGHTDLLVGTTFTRVNCNGTLGVGANNPIEDKATIYMTTIGAGGNGWSKPTSTSDTGPMPLGGAFVVSDSTVGTFVVGAKNGLCTASSVCSPEKLSFGFR